MSSMICLIACLVAAVSYVEGTGRMTTPLGRGYFRSADCTNFDIPLSQCAINWSDMNTNCEYSTSTDRSNCGVCGDFDNQDPAMPNVKDHEAGGQYARGVVVQTYGEAQTIDVTIEITANSLGSYEFSLCANDDFNTAAAEACFTVLADDMGTTEFAAMDVGSHTFSLVLPTGTTCTQCVLRWINKAANNWGTDADTGVSGLGFGPQRFFHACADVAIQGCATNCDACAYNADNSAVECTTCATGFRLVGTDCMACSANCDACALNADTSVVECTACAARFPLVNGACQACSDNCSLCALNADTSVVECTSCDIGFDLVLGACQAEP